MNERKIAFVTCVSDPELYAEAAAFIRALDVPDGHAVELVPVEGAAGMAQGYNAGMRRTDAKYKVYLHQDVLILHRRFLHDLLALFRSRPDVGLVGMIGARTLPPSGVWWESRDLAGKVYESHTGRLALLSFGEPGEEDRPEGTGTEEAGAERNGTEEAGPERNGTEEAGADRIGTKEEAAKRSQVAGVAAERIRTEEVSAERIRAEEVAVADGFLLATRADLPWREDLFPDWHFYDASQCMEFRKKGLKVVVPRQREPWCLHDCGPVRTGYAFAEARERFCRTYMGA